MIELFFLLIFISTQPVFCGDKLIKSAYCSKNGITSITNTKSHSSSSTSSDDSSIYTDSSEEKDDIILPEATQLLKKEHQKRDKSLKQQLHTGSVNCVGINCLLQNENSTIKMQLAEKDKKLAVQQKENGELRVKIVELNSVMITLNDNLDKLKITCETVQTKNQELIKEKDQLFDEKKDAYKQIKPLQDRIDGLLAEIKQLQNSNNNDQGKNFYNDNSCNENKLNGLAKINTDLGASILKLNEEISRLKREIEEVKQNLENANAQNVLQRIEIQTLDNTLLDKNTKIGVLESELQQKNQNLKENEQETAGLKNQSPEVITVFHTPWQYKVATGFFALTTGVASYAAYFFYKQKKVLHAK